MFYFTRISNVVILQTFLFSYFIYKVFLMFIAVKYPLKNFTNTLKFKVFVTIVENVRQIVKLNIKWIILKK